MYCYVVIYEIAARWSLVSEKERFEIRYHAAILSRHLGILCVDSLAVSRTAGCLWIYSGEAKGIENRWKHKDKLYQPEYQQTFWCYSIDIPRIRKSKLSLSCGLSLLLVLVLAPRVSLRVLRFSSLHKNQHFQIPSGISGRRATLWWCHCKFQLSIIFLFIIKYPGTFIQQGEKLTAHSCSKVKLTNQKSNITIAGYNYLILEVLPRYTNSSFTKVSP